MNEFDGPDDRSPLAPKPGDLSPDEELDLIRERYEAEASQWQYFEERDEPYEGDSRVCPNHPHIKTSSPDGMIDGLCWECESAMGGEEPTPEEYAAMQAAAEVEMATPEWKAERDRRAALGSMAIPDDDDIPF